MKPTIGRIVHLNVADDDGEVFQHAALVVGVLSDTEVALCVFDPRGGTSHASSVKQGTETGTWMWPAVV